MYINGILEYLRFAEGFIPLQVYIISLLTNHINKYKYAPVWACAP